MVPFVFLLLPGLSYASIAVTIKASATKDQSFITHNGEDTNIITDLERESFNITNNPLMAATTIHSGGKPTNVYVRSPTPWGDLYKTYNWSEVRRETKVKLERIVAVDKREVTLVKGVYTNNSTLNSIFRSNYEHEVENKVTNSFAGKKVSANVTYTVDLLTSQQNMFHFKFDSLLGNNTELVHTSQIKPAKDVSFKLKPSQSATAVLNATRVFTIVQVNYVSSLSGHLAVNYNPRYMGHHFWAYDVNAVLGSAKQPLVQRSTVVFFLYYYIDAKIIVVDNETGSVIKTEKAGYYD